VGDKQDKNMKTEKEVTELLATCYPQLDEAHAMLKKCIEEKNWEDAIEWCTAMQTAICVVNVAEGILDYEK